MAEGMLKEAYPRVRLACRRLGRQHSWKAREGSRTGQRRGWKWLLEASAADATGSSGAVMSPSALCWVRVRGKVPCQSLYTDHSDEGECNFPQQTNPTRLAVRACCWQPSLAAGGVSPSCLKGDVRAIAHTHQVPNSRSLSGKWNLGLTTQKTEGSESFILVAHWLDFRTFSKRSQTWKSTCHII